MQKINSLICKLREDFSDITFTESDTFKWDCERREIEFNTKDSSYALVLLHEVAHSVLNHEDYGHDIELVKMEAEAWGHVEDVLAPKYGVKFDGDLAENHIDSYRDWLHKRSTCPNCTINGCQNGEQTYKCPHCLAIWKVGSDKFKNIYRRKQNKRSK